MWWRIALFLSCLALDAAAAPLNVSRESVWDEAVDSGKSPWSVGVSYGVSTDTADRAQPRIYYQGVSTNLGYRLTSRWSLSAGLNAAFTTKDGQVDKLQEDTVYDASGVSPSLVASFRPEASSPWFASASAQALMDTASRREGYLALISVSAGGAWSFFNDRYTMTHGLQLTELANTYTTSSVGAANPGSSVGYTFGNSLRVTDWLFFNANFGLKQTRYLDGFWDYAYSTSLGLSLTRGSFSLGLQTSNGGYTEDGRVALWYVDEYRRIVSMSIAYQF